MAPKSAAALVLLAAMIAGLALPLQAQPNPMAVFSFRSLVDNGVCSGDDAMERCVDHLVGSAGTSIHPDCCRAVLKPVTSGVDKGCACGFGKKAADILDFDVFQRCHAANNPDNINGPSLKEFCKGN